MQTRKDWMKKYYTEEQLANLRQRWSPEVQAESERGWAELARDTEAAIASGADPTSDIGLQLAERRQELLALFTGGDPGMEQNLKKLYADKANWPASFKQPYSDAVDTFLCDAAEALSKGPTAVTVNVWGRAPSPVPVFPGKRADTAIFTLFRMQAVKHLPQLIGAGAINHPTAAAIGSLAEKQFAAAVAVGVYGVNQFESRREVEVILVGHSGIDLAQVVVDVGVRNQQNRILQVSEAPGEAPGSAGGICASALKMITG